MRARSPQVLHRLLARDHARDAVPADVGELVPERGVVRLVGRALRAFGLPPRRFTSSNARVYAALSSAGGAATAELRGLAQRERRARWRQCGAAAKSKRGVKRYWPGCVACDVGSRCRWLPSFGALGRAPPRRRPCRAWCRPRSIAPMPASSIVRSSCTFGDGRGCALRVRARPARRARPDAAATAASALLAAGGRCVERVALVARARGVDGVVHRGVHHRQRARSRPSGRRSRRPP